jgi:hypothetical protein
MREMDKTHKFLHQLLLSEMGQQSSLWGAACAPLSVWFSFEVPGAGFIANEAPWDA